MEPSIHDGAEVTLVCIDDVRVGDIIAYAYVDRVIVHRLVAQWGDRFVARGDANFLPDPVLVARDDVIGKVARPPAARRSPLASMFLSAIGVLGARTAMRIVGVLRTLHRRGRAATSGREQP